MRKFFWLKSLCKQSCTQDFFGHTITYICCVFNWNWWAPLWFWVLSENFIDLEFWIGLKWNSQLGLRSYDKAYSKKFGLKIWVPMYQFNGIKIYLCTTLVDITFFLGKYENSKQLLYWKMKIITWEQKISQLLGKYWAFLDLSQFYIINIWLKT